MAKKLTVDEIFELYIETFNIHIPMPMSVCDEFLAQVLLEHIEKNTPVPNDYDWYKNLPPGAVA